MPWPLNLLHKFVLCPFKLFEVIQKIGRVVSLSPLTPPPQKKPPENQARGGEAKRSFCSVFPSVFTCLSFYHFGIWL